ncbi:adenosine deaminase 2-like [Lucilia sericata]|uniref:adenosine deaminase 2-like n=1 Tax=Lucilia sericata TaxID=13632 RepID=UPI0018A850A5|nr:adenosine deaminase 2-like [Lucilia sericata]
MQQFCNYKFWLAFVLLIFTLTLFLIHLIESRYVNLPYLHYSSYENERKNIIEVEKWLQFGSRIKLTENEENLNKKLMVLKNQEYEKWQNNVTLRKLNGNFMKMRPIIQKSLLYNILKIMPKGAALHVHEEALANTRFLLNLTYEKDLWLCIDPKTEDYVFLRFSLQQPIAIAGYFNLTCQWQLLKDLRLVQGHKEIDWKLKKSFILNSLGEHSRVKLGKIKQLLQGLITFVPVWRKYLAQTYLECLMDNVQYLEMRSSLPELYDLQGNYYTDIVERMDIMRNSSRQMSLQSGNLYGSKLIYALTIDYNKTQFDLDLQNAILLKFFYPDFVIGIDLINDPVLQKNARPLKEFSSRLLRIQNRLDFYFTTPDLDWHNSKVDAEILESYVLGTKRITFHKALLRHPYLVTKLASKNMGIIINPIADQFNHNIADLRDHPASLLFHYNLPLIIGSDYPFYWKADLLTHDFYMVFMYIAPQQGDLKMLKQLAYNSIYYSGLEESKKLEVWKLWNFLWSHWIDEVNKRLNKLEIENL